MTAGCLALAAFLLALLARYPPIRDPGSTLSLRSLLEPQAVPPALTVACQGLAYGGVTGFLSLYGQELRIPNVGVCWLTYALGHAAARAASAKAFDRHGPRQLVLMGYALLMASFVCLALWRTAAGFAAAGLILGLGWALTFPTLQTMALEQVAPARRGASSATFFNGFDLGVFSGSYAMAFVAQAAGGYSGMYLVAAALLLAPVVLFLALTLPRYRPWKPAP